MMEQIKIQQSKLQMVPPTKALHGRVGSQQVTILILGMFVNNIKLLQ